MNLTISKKQAKDFLNDVAKYSKVSFVSDKKEADEMYEIAMAKGIIVKNSVDLAVIKIVYNFPDEANSNKEVVSKNELLKRLPTMIGKPLDVYHKRRYTVGYFIDYRYIEEKNMTVAYAIFFKYNFQEEYAKFINYFNAGKLKFSYKIWFEPKKLELKEDGTHILHDLQIGGGTIIPDGEEVSQPVFKKNSKGQLEPKLDANGQQVEVVSPIHPADKRCFVLAMAMEQIDTMSDEQFKNQIECLNSDLQEEMLSRRNECSGNCNKNCKCFSNQIVAELEAENVTIVDEEEPLMAEAKEEVKAVDEPKLEVLAEVKKEETKIEEPKVEEVKPEEPKILETKCQHCQNVLDNNLLVAMLEGQTTKCPACKSIVDKTGKEIYPPQEMDFNIKCYCGANNWLLLKDVGNAAEVKCQSCNKVKTLIFGQDELAEVRGFIEKLGVLRFGSVNCIQCGAPISYAQAGIKKEVDAKCPKCDLRFSALLPNTGRKRIIKKIEEAKEPALAKKQVEKEDEEDCMYAMVHEVKDSDTGEIKKIKEYPISDEKCVEDSLKNLRLSKNRKALQDKGISVKAVEVKILKRAKELGMEGLLKEHKKMSRELLKKAAKKILAREKQCKAQASTILENESKLSKLVEGMKKLAGLVMSEKNKVKDLQVAIASLQEKNEQDKKFYEANAKELYSRKQALASFEHGLTEEELLDNTKYELAIAKKQLAERPTVEPATASEIVGEHQEPVVKDTPTDVFSSWRNEINAEASKLFGKK